MMVIENKYDFGDIVYLRTDEEQLPRMVTTIMVCPGGAIMYDLTCEADVSTHYEIEIAAEKSVMA